MKKLISLAAVAAVLFSCSREAAEDVNPGGGDSGVPGPVLKIDLDGVSAGTKTGLSYENNVYKAYWSEGDQLNVWFCGGVHDGSEFCKTGCVYKVDEGSEGKASTTMSQVSADPNGDGDNAGSKVVSVYPFSEDNEYYYISENKGTDYPEYCVVINLSPTQKYSENTFANGAQPMIAVAEGINETLHFKNVCGVLKLRLTGDATVRYIRVTGNADEYLCGPMDVLYDEGEEFAVSEMEGGEDEYKTVTLDCGEDGVKLKGDEETPFYIVIPPTEFAEGFTVEVETTEGITVTKKSSLKSTHSTSGSVVLKMPPFKLNGPDYVHFVSEGTSTIWLGYSEGFNPNLINLEYSKDDKKTWTKWAVGSGTINGAENQPILEPITYSGTLWLRGINVRIMNQFHMEGDSAGCYGNVMTLIDYTKDFPDLSPVCFQYLFKDCDKLTHAPDLPATSLAHNCYYEMFMGCTSLTEAPTLPSVTTVSQCYYRMFYGCTNLGYVKCLATDISGAGCTDNWLYGVASEGTFVKSASMTGWTDGASGIPSGWTVQDAQ